MPKRIVLVLTVVCFLAGCSAPARKPAPRPLPPPVAKPAPQPPAAKPLPPPQIMPPTVIPKAASPLLRVPDSRLPLFADDMDMASLERAMDKSLAYFRKASSGKAAMHIEETSVSAQDLQESLIALQEILRSGQSDEVKQERIRETFDVYQSTGSDGKNTVLFTGYFESIMKGALEPSQEYRYPVYRVPDDALTVNLGKFNPKYRNDQLVGRVRNGELIPYYSRSEIENQGVLAGRNLEIVWVNDRVDLFFLHTQGSGKIELPDGTLLQIGYALRNGRPFQSIAPYLLKTGKITPQETSYREIKRYLKNHPDELSEILGQNESFIFFRRVEEGPVGAIQEVLTAGRSIAIDPDLFPKGALAFIRTRKPVLDRDGRVSAWIPYSRFVLSQDVGGAIKGAGRVDLFCGSGAEAEMLAGSLKEKGELYFLVKKR